MTIVQKMRAQLTEAMKARDAVRTQFLRYWIAQLTAATGAELSDADAVKKMRGVLKEAKGGQTSFTPEELALIEQWLPATMTRDQVADFLGPLADQIRKAPKDGIAMGIAMKSLVGYEVDSDDVKAVVASLRSASHP